MPGRAQRGRRAGVREDVVLLGLDVVAVVDVLDRAGGAGAAVGAAVAVDGQLQRRQLAVLRRSGLDRLDRRTGGCRTARCSSLRSRKSLTGAPASFASFAAVTPSTPAPNFAPKPPPMYSVMTRIFDAGIFERLGELVAHGEDALRRGPDRQLVALPARHEAVGLERAVRLDLRHVGALDDGVGLAGSPPRRRPCRTRAGPGRCPSRARLFARRLDVAGGRLRLGLALEDEGRVGLARRRRGRRRRAAARTRPRIAREGVVGLLGRVGGDGGDLLPGEAELVSGLRRSRGRPARPASSARPRGRRLHGGRREGAAQDPAVEHSRQAHVDRVPRRRRSPWPGRRGAARACRGSRTSARDPRAPDRRRRSRSPCPRSSPSKPTRSLLLLMLRPPRSRTSRRAPAVRRAGRRRTARPACRDAVSALRRRGSLRRPDARPRARRRRRRGGRCRSGRGCPATASRISSRVGFGLRSSSALQDRTIPEVQKPHWRASAATKASWSGVSRPSAARPSIVVIGLPGDLVREQQAGADGLAVEQDRAGAAGAAAADDLGAGQADAVAQRVDEHDARLDADPVDRAVDVERERRGAGPDRRRSRRRGPCVPTLAATAPTTLPRTRSRRVKPPRGSSLMSASPRVEVTILHQ